MIFPLIKIKNYDRQEQTEKIESELEEFLWEDPHTDKEISEALDLIQATLTYITHEYTQEEIAEAVDKHYSKLYNRKHTIDNIIRISLEKHNV